MGVTADKGPSCSKLEEKTGAWGGSKPAVVLFETSWLIQLRREPSAGLSFPHPLHSVSKAIRMGGHHIGQRLVPWGFKSDKSNTELFFRVVSDGNRDSRKSFDDRTLKQKHIFGLRFPTWGPNSQTILKF